MTEGANAESPFKVLGIMYNVSIVGSMIDILAVIGQNTACYFDAHKLELLVSYRLELSR